MDDFINNQFQQQQIIDMNNQNMLRDQHLATQYMFDDMERNSRRNIQRNLVYDNETEIRPSNRINLTSLYAERSYAESIIDEETEPKKIKTIILIMCGCMVLIVLIILIMVIL